MTTWTRVDHSISHHKVIDHSGVGGHTAPLGTLHIPEHEQEIRRAIDAIEVDPNLPPEERARVMLDAAKGIRELFAEHAVQEAMQNEAQIRHGRPAPEAEPRSDAENWQAAQAAWTNTSRR